MNGAAMAVDGGYLSTDATRSDHGGTTARQGLHHHRHGSGMGRAAASRLRARVHASSAATSTPPRRGDAHGCARGGGDMISVQPCDLSKRADVDRLVDATLAKHGCDRRALQQRVDGLLRVGDGDDVRAWSRTLREELDVVFHACQAVLPHMTKRGRGSIINVGSTSGKVAYQVLPALAHMAAKGA
jgi:NAD(P)-dependent dehydrogenase (short-subunit alcohol dehydrogenase family)